MMLKPGNVINMNGLDSFATDMVMGATAHGFNHSALNYVQNNITHLANSAVGAAKDFYQSAQNTFNQYMNSDTMDRIKSLVYRKDDNFRVDNIYLINQANLADISPTMMRYAMIQPDTFKLNQNNTCNAFGDLYVDMDPDEKNLEDKYDYQRVMSGFVDDTTGNAVSYYQSYVDGEEELTFEEQCTVQESWHNMRQIILDGLDPTDPDLGEL